MTIRTDVSGRHINEDYEKEGRAGIQWAAVAFMTFGAIILALLVFLATVAIQGLI